MIIDHDTEMPEEINTTDGAHKCPELTSRMDQRVYTLGVNDKKHNTLLNAHVKKKKDMWTCVKRQQTLTMPGRYDVRTLVFYERHKKAP